MKTVWKIWFLVFYQCVFSCVNVLFNRNKLFPIYHLFSWSLYWSRCRDFGGQFFKARFKSYFSCQLFQLLYPHSSRPADFLIPVWQDFLILYLLTAASNAIILVYQTLKIIYSCIWQNIEQWGVYSIKASTMMCSIDWHLNYTVDQLWNRQLNISNEACKWLLSNLN